MQHRTLFQTCVLLLAVTACLPPTDSVRAGKGGKPKGRGPAYDIIPLDDVEGLFLNGAAADVNDTGGVVGIVDDPITGDRLAAYWRITSANDGVQSELHLISGGVSASPEGINDHGEIVGNGVDPNGELSGLYWSNRNAQPLVLAPLAGDTQTSAQAISNSGVICGASSYPVYGLDEDENVIVVDSIYRAVVWRITDTEIFGPLKLPSDDVRSFTNDLTSNDSEGSADVVGGYRSLVDDFQVAAVKWTVASLPDGSLVVDPAPVILNAANGSEARSINNQGTVCGTLGAPWQAVVWGESGPQTLDSQRGVTSSTANDINIGGGVVGSAKYEKRGAPDWRAVVWPSASGEMVQLDKHLARDSTFASLQSASAASGQGHIVGRGWNGETGTYAAYLAVPK